MKFPFHLLLCPLLALFAGCATPQAKAPAAEQAHAPLLLVSIDGYRHDYIERGLSPTLSALARDGVHAVSMQPSFPSLTFPNHYTIVTGLRPDHHGVVNNTMSDPALGKFSLGSRNAVSDGRWWAEGKPIWENADRHGVRTGIMFWPGSEAEIHGMRPDYWKPFDGAMTPEQRVDQVLAWLDLPADQRPGFLTLYFDGVDHAGHLHGPDSPEVDQALRDTDAAMARLVDGLKQRKLLDRINLIVLSDHGMASVPLDNSVLIDQLAPIDQVQTVSMGIVAGFNPKSDSAADRDAFDKVAAALEQPHPHMQCMDKSQVPARLAYGSNARVPQLLCIAELHWRITTSDYVAKRKSRMSIGEHGYDNIEPDMQALFVAHGPAFEQGQTAPAFPNVDVYPLMTHLLGLPADHNDGDYQAVSGMLKPAAR